MEVLTSRARAMGLNVIHDGTLKSRSQEREIGAYLKSPRNYRIEGHYMYTPLYKSAIRSVQRYVGRNGKRGRMVPLAVSLSNVHNEANFDYLKRYFDKWSAYDNGLESRDGHHTPLLIQRGRK